MKTRNGFTFIEVMIASAILIVVFIIIYAVFSTTDVSYRNESSLRTAQLNAQRVVDEFVNDASESARGKIWRAPITIIPTNPGNLTNALVYLSARNSSGQYIASGVNPDWQNTVAIIPLPAPSGPSYELVRFRLPEPTVGELAAVNSTVVITPALVMVEFRNGVGTLLGPGVSIARNAGHRLLTADITGFNLQGYQSRGTTGGNTVGSGGTWNNSPLEIMEIGIQIRVVPPQGPAFSTGYITTIRGRNQ